jgi:hypothetical protein
MAASVVESSVQHSQRGDVRVVTLGGRRPLVVFPATQGNSFCEDLFSVRGKVVLVSPGRAASA